MQPSFLPISIKSHAIDQLVRSAAASYGPRSRAGQRPHALLIHPDDQAELPGFAHALVHAIGIDTRIHFVNEEGETEHRFFDPHPDALVIEHVERFTPTFTLRLALAYANPRHTRPALALFVITRPLKTMMEDGTLDPRLAMRMTDTLVWPKTPDRRRDLMPLFQAFVQKLAARSSREIEIDPATYQCLRQHWRSEAPKSVLEIRQLAERAVMSAEHGRLLTPSSIRTAIEVPAVLLASP